MLQIIASTTLALSLLQYELLAITITFPLAALSWFLVESPMLKLKHRYFGLTQARRSAMNP